MYQRTEHVNYVNGQQKVALLCGVLNNLINTQLALLASAS